MCKRIKDILWPFNIFGKKIVSIPYKLPDGDTINVQVVWEGERLQMCYTHIVVDRTSRKITKTPVKRIAVLGVEIDENIVRGNIGRYHYAVGANDGDAPEHNVIYFKCTNVTSLIVNGEQII